MTQSYDIVIFGGTPAGIAAAVQARTDGRSVALLEPGHHLGGMTTSGLGATDFGNKRAVGGIAREFYRRVGDWYEQPESWFFEPHVAADVFARMLREAGVTPQLGQRLGSVEKGPNGLAALTTAQGRRFEGSVFIDASYEGDLMAAAGVSHRIGREANAEYGETLNGLRAQTFRHQFSVPVDPYRVPGDRRSGLLPYIVEDDGAAPGTGDRRVQAYNYRLCLTRDNPLPILPPPDYDTRNYELLARYLAARQADGSPLNFEGLFLILDMPNGKTDFNNWGGFSTDFIGGSDGYPEAGYDERERIARAHEHYIRGLFHFLKTDPRVCPAIRQKAAAWGLPRDEFGATGGWPPQLYVREARRMVGGYVMTELNCRSLEKADDPVGLGAYTMDSHNCRRIARNGEMAENEGNVEIDVPHPYPISYRSILPKPGQCDNLLVPVCLSATHIAYGSIRMEPVFMVLGQSAACAATLAFEHKSTPQNISYPELRRRLERAGQILEWKPETEEKPAVGKLAEPVA